MNKNRMILAAVGGGLGLVILVLAFLTWMAFADKTAAIAGDEEEGTDGLETVVEKAESLSRKPIFPSKKSVTAIASNQQALVEWKDETLKLASRGDKVFPATTPAAFKTFLVADAKRLATLPGAVQNVLVKPDFKFGPFGEYISEGKMPAEGELAELQRRWDDVATVVELLSASGIAELTDVQFAARPVPESAADRKNTRKAGKKAGKKDPEPVKEPSVFTYTFAFTTRPVGFIKAMNALATGERFTVVDDFSFLRQHDQLAAALGGEDAKKNEQTSGRRRRGRRAAAVEEPKEDVNLKNGIVTDPLLDEPFAVTMTVSVYDFRSLEDEDKSEEVK